MSRLYWTEGPNLQCWKRERRLTPLMGQYRMIAVYLLWHTHDLGDDEEDQKLIGVYASEADAELARQRTIVLPGFRDAPEGFVIDRYPVGRDHWEEGYFTYTYAAEGDPEKGEIGG